MLNKQDTSIVTLALLLAIATSPVAWAASRLNSNSSATTSATSSESLWQSSDGMNSLNLNTQPSHQAKQKNVQPQAVSKASIASKGKRETSVHQTDSLIAQFNGNKNNLVGQSPQAQQSTLAVSNGDVPVWLWWLVPVVPLVGLWLRFKLKQQSPYSGAKISDGVAAACRHRNSSPLSSKPDDLTEKSQPTTTTSSQILTEKNPFTQSTQPLVESESSTFVQNSIEAEPDVILDQSLTLKSSSEEPINPIEQNLPNPVQESILVEEIPEPEAEAVIAEFLNTKNTNLNPSNQSSKINNSTEEETILPQSEAEEEPLTVQDGIEPEVVVSETSAVEKEVAEPEVILSQSLTVEEVAEPEVRVSETSPIEEDKSLVIEEVIKLKVVIAKTTRVEEEPLAVEEITEPEILISEASPVEEEKPLAVEEVTEPEVIISETLTDEEESLAVEEITEPEVVISEASPVEEEEPLAVEEVTEPEVVVSETLIDEEDQSLIIEEIAEPEVVTSETSPVEEEKPLEAEQVTEPEAITSELKNPNLMAETSSEPELSMPHPDIKTETDVVAMKFNIGGQRKFEPSLADVDEGLPNLPDGYGHSKIILLPRDPNWAYAYWDVPNEHKEHIRQQGGRYLLLRVYDVTAINLDSQPPHWTHEYECDEMTKDWYIPVPMSDHDYIVELGYQTIDGRWLVLVRSNHIRIPPIYPTDWENDQFINIPWNEDLRGKTFFRL